MAEVPLKIRVDIRDLWDSPKSAVQKSVEALEKTLGHKIAPQAQWPALWNELKDRYPDKTTFVPTICRITIAWYERLLWRLDSDHFPEWTEELLSTLSQAPRGRIQLLIEPSSTPRPQTSWKASSSIFTLTIPKTDPPTQSKVEAAFDQDFENLLTSTGETATNEEGWADVAAETRAPAPSSTPAQPLEEQPSTRRLPNINTIPRPNELLTTTAPYFLKFDGDTVQCSHEPSIELLAAYLNKWGRTNISDSLKRNIFKIELTPSFFYSGVNDTMTIEYYMGNQRAPGFLNPTIILAFIEGVLGYKLVHTTGHSWLYRSDVLFK